MIRRVLFQVHMWTGLTLGVLFVLLGLSGSVLVFNEEIARWSSPRATAAGAPASLDRVVAAARSGTDGPVFLILPKETGDPVLVRFLPSPRTFFVDPVSARVLGSRASPLAPLIQAMDELHGNLFLGPTGRKIVGWLGIAMTLLGLSGLVLWWPSARQWTLAFIVRRRAKGLRFHRELHGAAGIWGLVVFLVVAVTGVSMVFADDIRAVAGDARSPSPMRGPDITPAGTHPLDIQATVDLARRALPHERVRSVVVRPGAATSVAMSEDNAPMLTLVYVDPYRARVVAVRDPYRLGGADGYIAWQKPLHIAEGLGPVWRLLVFLSGFLPLLFVVTGVTMWAKKRRNRLAMNRPLEDRAAVSEQ